MAFFAGAGMVSSFSKVVVTEISNLSGDKARMEGGIVEDEMAVHGAWGECCLRGKGSGKDKFLLATL